MPARMHILQHLHKPLLVTQKLHNKLVTVNFHNGKASWGRLAATLWHSLSLSPQHTALRHARAHARTGGRRGSDAQLAAGRSCTAPLTFLAVATI